VSRRLFLTIVGVAVLALTLFGIPLGIAVHHRNRDDADHELERLASTAALQLRAPPSGPDPVDLPATEPGDQLAGYDLRGSRTMGDGPPSADAVTTAALDGQTHIGASGSDRVAAVPVLVDDRVTAVVRAAEPLAEANHRTYGAWLAMAGLGATVLGLAAVAALVLVRHFGRPVQRLRDAAVRLGEGDFTVTPPHSGLRELDEVADALSATAGRIGALIERERAFTADASHQLRTPLASLRLAIEAELAHPRSDRHLVLTEALRDVERLDSTVTGLLALARDNVAPSVALALAPLLVDVERRWRPTAARAGRPLRVDADTDVRVAASEAAVHAIADVLIDNAMRHGHGAVNVSTERAGAQVRLVVSDDGAIEASADEVFTRRSVAARHHGIGLALARSLAHAEGGRLRLATRCPTTFELLLPQSTPPETADASASVIPAS
jgi:signal transduction histidine kinase